MTEGFATKFREREEAERMEKEKMKQMVLNIHERQEEEDYQGNNFYIHTKLMLIAYLQKTTVVHKF